VLAQEDLVVAARLRHYPLCVGHQRLVDVQARGRGLGFPEAREVDHGPQRVDGVPLALGRITFTSVAGSG
jgi:hypothetical protein